MKKEFDELKERYTEVFSAMWDISQNIGSSFYDLFFSHDARAANNDSQKLFTLAWYKPSLIEVVEPEKHLVELNNGTRLQKDDDVYSISSDALCGFTLEEVKEAEEQLGIQGLQAKWYEAAKEEQK